MWSSRWNGCAGYIGTKTLGSTGNGDKGKEEFWLERIGRAARPQGGQSAGSVRLLFYCER